jgi:hypothetical protein
MKHTRFSMRTVLLGCVLSVATLFATTTFAATTWTDWTSATVGAPGSAAGTVSGVGVSYSGEVIGSVINGTSGIWAPNSSFIGGTVTASPSVVNDDIRLQGSFTGPQTITFGTPVVNPVFAIWSLGQPGLTASFVFNATPTLQAGGPNAQFGGQSIIVNGNTVTGNEGNGVVQFTGTFSSLSWTNSFEFFYAFTVGLNGPVGAIPEPETYAMLLAGLGLLGFAARRRQHKRA